MRQLCFLASILFTLSLQAQFQENFEGNTTVNSWQSDDCVIDTSFQNPYQQGINTSNTVLEYKDVGGGYANTMFDVATNFNLNNQNTFSLKIYVPSTGVTGSQNNQVSLKLQNNTLGNNMWTTQTEIVHSINLDQWQQVTFNFKSGDFINASSESKRPVQREDLNRVVVQVNGEDNSDSVVAYIDDVTYFNIEYIEPVYDTIVWSDEFDDDGAIDGTKWFHQTQFIIDGNSWANNEEQVYTDRLSNSYISGGTLKIKAKKEQFTDQGTTKEYTSARLNSKYSFRYGRVVIRAKLPSVAGTWPAIWMLGRNITETGGFWAEDYGTVAWPYCGETDIMEPNVEKTEILGTWHWYLYGLTPEESGHIYNTQGIETTNADTSDNWHDYSLVWTPESMKIYMDATLINEIGVFSPFSNPNYILLNLAMGGSLGGAIDPNFNNDIMEIDYVRVYQQSTLSSNSALNIQTTRIYPNPVGDLLNIQFKNSQSQQAVLNVYDISGRMIADKKVRIVNQKIEYNTAALNSGIYVLTLTLDSGDQTNHKFIKH